MTQLNKKAKSFMLAPKTWILTLLFCSTSPLAAGPLTIYTVNYPLKYFAERIAGEHANVVFPATPDVDPAFWMPNAETIVQYQQADLILLNGADYARWINKVSLPRLKLVDTSKDFKNRYLTVSDATTHSHGLEGEHSHAGTFFSTWLDFSQAAQQARAIAGALSRIDPDHKTDFERNYKALEKDLLALDKQIKAAASASAEQPLVASHPIYQYLARRYGLNIQSVLWEPDEEPSEEQWAEMQQILIDHPAATMIWEGAPLQASIDRLRSLGIESIVFDPCANSCDSGSFLDTMQDNVANLNRILR
ncbi:MAG: zinc ABC transporter substrate-binding protein [Gammaproteobacteria bacterium]|nr:zinc ABC transporter substrate-binding protein [Gammaproteobacteria bacterium]